MKLFRTLAVAATSTVLVAGPAVAAFACEEHQVAALTGPARSATAKYHSVTVAKKTGYSILADSAGITCIAEPQMGAMGVHYVKGDLVKNPSIRHASGSPCLCPRSTWRATPGCAGIRRDQVRLGRQPTTCGSRARDIAAPPMLFGHKFSFTDAPNRYGLPPFYSLHAWVWKGNPAGTFEMWNPSVHCDET